MVTRVTLKDHFRESRLFNDRAVFALVIVALLFAVIIARMIKLQVIDHAHFTTLSNENRIAVHPIAPTRGLIYDRNGEILAQNLPAFSLEIIPEKTTDLDETIRSLQALLPLTDSELKRFRRQLRQKRPFKAIPLRYHLSDQEVARLAVNLHLMPGVEINARLIRDYPLAGLMAHSLGYVSRINEEELQHLDTANYRGTRFTGKTGIEKFYESELHGQVGFEHVETNALGRTLRIIKRSPATPGQNLYLTIDSNLQQVAVQAMAEHHGAIIAIDPENGDILADVSLPTFDPNLFVTGIDHKSFAALRDSPSRPLFNRAINGQYPPGSTLKPFIGLAGLANNKVRINTTSFCPGWFSLPGDDHKYRDWKKRGHGVTTLGKAIIESCDVYFYDLAQALGIDLIHPFLGQFGFGLPTGIDTSHESSGLLPSRQWKRARRQQPWYPGETLITGIGQGYTLTTPLQLATATAVLGRRGQSIKPRLVFATQTADDPAMQIRPPRYGSNIHLARPSDWEDMISAMRKVISYRKGTAHRIHSNRDYTIAGKTGTAQVFGIKQDEVYKAADVAKRFRDHALFIAFAPADAPQIAVAVIIENGGHGSSVAAPVAAKIIDTYMQQISERSQ